MYFSAIWLALFWRLGIADHSILDIINKQYVEKLLADQVNNETKEFTLRSSLNGLDELLSENVVNEGNLPDINGNSVVQSGRFAKNNLPDISSVLSELARGDKLLKAEPTSLLVTKKEYLRKDWCRTEPILQRIKEDGCIPKNVVNRFCYGQCNSFFIPKNLGPRRGRKRKNDKSDEAPSFRSCGVCKPKKMHWVQVTLNCPGENPPLRRRKVHKVKQCQCLAETVN